jgi:SAM-dependent methyltransferase
MQPRVGRRTDFPLMSPGIVCGSTEWIALPDPGPRSMLSDWRVVDEPLARTACAQCGLACRRPSSTGTALYESGYTLYAHAPGAPREDARQRHYARWIASMVKSKPTRVLDVGCGNGSLLRALRTQWPAADLRGCDPSGDAIAHGAGDSMQLWQGTASDLPPGLAADVVLTVNVIEHTRDPLLFLQDVRRALTVDGSLVVICPDGGRPGLELLFADHVFSYARPHLETLFLRAGFDVVGAALAPAELGAFQMMVGRPAEPRHASAVIPAQVPGRAAYLSRWGALDEHLMARMRTPAVCFGAGEAAGLLRAYAPNTWSLVRACTVDDPPTGTFGGLPVLPLDAVPCDETLLLGVRPGDQPRLAARLRSRFPHVVAWYDLVDDD